VFSLALPGGDLSSIPLGRFGEVAFRDDCAAATRFTEGRRPGSCSRAELASPTCGFGCHADGVPFPLGTLGEIGLHCRPVLTPATLARVRFGRYNTAVARREVQRGDKAIADSATNAFPS